MNKNITAAILAGGANKRFNGQTKANLVIEGKKIISRIFESIRDVFSEIIIVTNSPDEFKDQTGFILKGDHYLNIGPLGGIHAALKATSNDNIFVFAGDMPLLDKKLIIDQINFFNNIDCEVLIPLVNTNIEPMHAIYSVMIIKKLEEYVTNNHDHSVHEFLNLINVSYWQPDDSAAVRSAFTNINSPADLAGIEKYFKEFN